METLFTQLDRDWEVLARRSTTAVQLAPVLLLAGVESPADLVGVVRTAPPGDADQVLNALATLSAARSETAARTLLQLLLPGTCRLAARWWALGSAEDRAAAAVAAVYDRIRRYPIDRRPRKIAANILLDANQDLARLARRATLESERTSLVAPDRLPAPDPYGQPSPAEELVSVVADAVTAGVIRREDAELIVSTRVHGDDLPSLARRRGAKLRTLQWRRKTAEDALVAAGAVA